MLIIVQGFKVSAAHYSEIKCRKIYNMLDLPY